MGWAQIFAELASALKSLIDHIGDATRWKMSVNGTPAGTVTSVTVTAPEMVIAFNDGQDDHTLRAMPGPNHAAIDFDGAPASDARLVFRVVSEPLAGKSVIGVFEFGPLTVNGAVTQYRFDYPK
jgi:hypothetical protein